MFFDIATKVALEMSQGTRRGWDDSIRVIPALLAGTNRGWADSR
jgi:hypothetical protein